MAATPAAQLHSPTAQNHKRAEHEVRPRWWRSWWCAGVPHERKQMDLARGYSAHLDDEPLNLCIGGRGAWQAQVHRTVRTASKTPPPPPFDSASWTGAESCSIRVVCTTVFINSTRSSLLAIESSSSPSSCSVTSNLPAAGPLPRGDSGKERFSGLLRPRARARAGARGGAGASRGGGVGESE